LLLLIRGSVVRSHHGSPSTSANPFGQLLLVEVLTTLPCENATDPCDERYRKVTIMNHPSDEAFWQFEARIAVRAMVGIP